MSNNKINKIVKDLQSNNEKTIILALMYITRLQIDEYYEEENFNKLKTLINQFHTSTNPDISYLSGKAKNFLANYIVSRDKTNSSTVRDISSKNLKKSAKLKVDHTNSSHIANSIKPDPALVTLQNYSSYLNHTDDRCRAKAVEICAKSFPQDQLDKILTPMLGDQNNRVRANVIVALKETNPIILNQSLQEMLSSPRISMRESAIWAISKLYSNELYRSLLMKALHDPYRDIRLRAIQALRAYHCNDVIVQMKRLSTDSDSSVSEKAMETLQYFKKYKATMLDTSTSVRGQFINPKNSESFITLNDDTKDSIIIKDRFLDLPESSKTFKVSKPPSKHLNVNDPCTDSVGTKEIAKKIDLHQKLQSLNVEEFFNAIKLTDHNQSEIDWKELSSPTSDVISWIPEEYQPDKYKLNVSSEKQVQVSLARKARNIRNKISELLMEVGYLQLNQQNKSNTRCEHLNSIRGKIVNISQKIRKVKNDKNLKSHQKKNLIQQLQQNSKEALIQLGRASIKEHHRNEYKCSDLDRYQRKLKQLINHLTKINHR